MTTEKNEVTKMTKTLFNQLTDLLTHLDLTNLTEENKSFKYVNIEDEKDYFTDFKVALKLGLNLSKYKEVEIIESGSKTVLKSLFGSNNYKITEEDKKLTSNLIEVLNQVVLGIKKPLVTTKKKRTITKLDSDLVTKYFNEGLTIKEIAAKFKVSNNSIRQKLNGLKLDLKKQPTKK